MQPLARLQQFIAPLILAGFIVFPATALASEAPPATTQAHWEDGELAGPLPEDPAARRAAIAEAVRLGQLRQSQWRPGDVHTAQGLRVEPAPVHPRRPKTDRSPAATALPRLSAPGERVPAREPSGTVDIVAPAPETQEEISRYFDAIDFTGWTPPSPDIAVGPDHVVVVANNAIAIYDKCGNWLEGGTFIDYFGWPSDNLHYDARVVYDHYYSRWLVACIDNDFNDETSRVRLRASYTADPTDGWVSEYYAVPAAGYFADNMYIACAADRIYITYNQFAFEGYAFVGFAFWIYDSEDVYNNSVTTVWYGANFQNPADATLAFSVRPAQMRTFGGEMYMLNNKHMGGDFVTLWKFTSATPPTFTIGSLGTNTYLAPSDMRQADGSYLDSMDARFTDLVYDHGNLFAANITDIYSGGGYHPALTITTVFPASSGVHMSSIYDGSYRRAYPAFDVDDQGRLVFVFARCDDYGYAGIGVEVRDPYLGWHSPGTEMVALGEGTFTLDGSGTVGDPYRWGNYFGAALDPADHRTVWTVGAYASVDPWPSWATRVAPYSYYDAEPLVVSPVGAQLTGGVDGGTFSPSSFTYTLENPGGTGAYWNLDECPNWLTPSTASGYLPPGGGQEVTVSVNTLASMYNPGTYTDTLRFDNCMGPSVSAVREVTLGVVEPLACEGATVDLMPENGIPHGTTGNEALSLFVTPLEDVDMCGFLTFPGSELLSIAVYEADYTTRGALLAENTGVAAERITGGYYVLPLGVRLEACRDYEIVVQGPSSHPWAWYEPVDYHVPYDVNGLFRIHNSAVDGDVSDTRLPHMTILASRADDRAVVQTTDLFPPDAVPGTASNTDIAAGLYITALDNIELRRIGVEADLPRGSVLRAVVYEATGETRASTALSYGRTVVDRSGMSRHEVPVNATLEYAREYDVAVTFDGIVDWPVVNEFDTSLPYWVDDVIKVRRAESNGNVSLLIPHLWLDWEPTATGGASFDLGKFADGPAPLTGSGQIDHGAYIEPLCEQRLYGLGVEADIPEGTIIFARVYSTTPLALDRNLLLAEGWITSPRGGTRWHDIPIAINLTTKTYDLSVVAATSNSYPYWEDTPGIPYEPYGAIRVLDGDHGGWEGSTTLIHMRFNGCDNLTTAVEDRPPPITRMFIEAAAPNPAGNRVTFRYSMEAPARADMEIFDVLGRRVATVFNSRRVAAGPGTADFDATGLRSGVYFVKLSTATAGVSRKFVITR